MKLGSVREVISYHINQNIFFKQALVKGELWLGLRKLHQLTSAGDYSLNITLTDFDGKSYNAYYDQFQVIAISLG